MGRTAKGWGGDQLQLPKTFSIGEHLYHAIYFLFNDMNANAVLMVIMRGKLAEQYGENRSRRRFIREAAGAGISAVGVPVVASNVVGANHESPEYGETSLYSQSGMYREWVAPDIYYDHHLGSSIEHMEQDPGGSHEFRIAGDFCMVMQDGTLPPETPASVLSQGIRIENESPWGLSVFTSSNSSEIAMNPKPTNFHGGSYASAFSAATGALSLAATVAGSATGGLALGATSLASGMYALLDNGDTSTSGVYQWDGSTPGTDDRRGGHHADFGVDEHGGGSIKMTSEIAQVKNEWRLTFDNGLTAISQL